MPPNLNRYFDIARWVAGKADFSEGSVEIFFHGIPMGLGGQLVVTDAQHGLSFDVSFADSEMFVSSQLESLWWSLDGRTTAEVFLANTRTEAMSVTPTFHVGGAAITSEPIVLACHESQVLDIGRALKRLNVDANKVRGGLTLRSDKQPGALVVAGAIMNRQKGFSSTMRFIDVAAQHSIKLDGAHLLIGKPSPLLGLPDGASFVPRVTVRNISSRSIQIHSRVLYQTEERSNIVRIAPVTLAADEVKELDMSVVIASVGTTILTDAGIEIKHDGSPSAIVTAIASVNQDGSQVFDVPLRDPKSPSLGGGSYPWRVDGNNRAVVHLKNIDPPTESGPRQAMVVLYYEGGSYTLPVQHAEAGQTLAIDIKRLRDEQVKDSSGNTIPRNITKGQVRWFGRGTHGKFVGRLAQYDPVAGTASSFSCPTPCTCDQFYKPLTAHVTVSPSSGVPGTIATLKATETDTDCHDNLYPNIDVTADTIFWSKSPSTVLVTGNTATFLAPGQTDIEGDWSVTSGAVDVNCDYLAGGHCLTPTCAYDDGAASDTQSVTVKPRISGPTAVWYFNGENPSGYATQITLTTSTNATSWQWTVVSGSDKVSLSGNGTGAVTVTGIAPSANPNDVSITVKVNGVTSNAYRLSVLVPHQLVYIDEEDLLDGDYGYTSIIDYQLFNQFGNQLPSSVPINEHFTSSVISDFAGSNWKRGAELGGAQLPGNVQDWISGQLLSAIPAPYPTPIHPCTLTLGYLCNTPVHHFTGEIYVGSLVSGRGRRVETLIWQRYTDHASHTNRVSPAP
jgi:hypothetical protein